MGSLRINNQASPLKGGSLNVDPQTRAWIHEYICRQMHELALNCVVLSFYSVATEGLF